MQLEDWYFAIWAYNSGVNPQASTGNTTGCTPGPSCADSAGNWGLGWTNNPANPTYDPLRHPFLHDDLGDLTYGDAATPQDWPYQEKVFGWIESGQYEGDGITLKYTPTYDYITGTGFFLDLPSVYAFCDGSDNCDSIASQPCGYNADSDPLQWHCWWHKSAGTCFGGCHTGDWNYTVNDAEPAVANPFPSVCSPPGDFTDTYLVDDSMSETNLAGCTGMAAANAPMVWLPNQDPNGQPFGDVDLHQLGTGYGGRTMFTHLEDTSNALWGGTMAWAPNNLDYDVYDIEVFIPTLGAAGTLTYTVYNQGFPVANVPIDQNDYGNQWVSIGTYYLAPGSKVTTTNVVSGGDGATDVAFDAVAFRPVSSYVSLGDSYSSGEGTGSYDPGTDVSGVNQCHRSPNSYARVWAAGHGASGVPMIQLACSGAVTSNLTTTGQWNEPAQIPATPKHAVKVFLTIGGNDVGFAAVLTHCLNPLLTCEDYYNQDDGNNEDNVIDAIEPQLASVYTQIAQRAPQATIIALTYPSLFEPASTCSSIVNLPVSDVTWLIGEAAHLDDAVVQAAGQAGIQVVDERDAFVGHELCTSTPWVYSLPILWTNGTQVFDSSAWFHPTVPGQARLAADLAAHVTAAGVRQFTAVPGAWMPRHLPPGVPTGASARTELLTIKARNKVVTTLPTPSVPYNRDDSSQFGSGWRSRQNCKVRDRVLRRDALTAAEQPTNFVALAPAVGTPINSACPVTAGTWDWPYEASLQTPAAPVIGQYLTQTALAEAGGMQIDHIVPLGDAWNSGAWNWTKNTRLDFANDLNLPQLWAVSQPSNGSKSDQDPSQWMPPNAAIACTYAAAWVEVKYKYGLLMTKTEYNSLTTTLAPCT